MTNLGLIFGIVAVVVGVLGVALGVSSIFFRRRSQREFDRTKWRDFMEAYEKEIALAERLGNEEQATRLRREFAIQLEAWRASQEMGGLAPRTISQEAKASLTPEEVERLRAQLSVAESLSPGAQSAEDYLQRGSAQYRSGQLEEAIASYDRALGLSPDFAQALYNKGQVLGSLGRTEEAIEVYDTVVERFGEARSPNLRELVAMSLVNSGTHLGDVGRQEEAIEVYDAVMERFGEARSRALRAQVAMAYFNKACAYSQLEDGEAALAWLRQAIEKDAKYRAQAWTDPDFAFLREHPEYGPQFRELVGEEELPSP